MIGRSLFDARLELVELPQPVRAQSTHHIIVRLTKHSDGSWPARGDRPVHLSYHWLDRSGATVIHDGVRTPIPDGISLEEPTPLVMDVQTPPAAGDFRLRLTLVQENVAWFEDRGFQPLDLDIAVFEPDRDGLEERRLKRSSARYRRILEDRRRHRSYRTWSEYLRWAMVNHEFHAPYGDGDRHVLAMLESQADRLARSYRSREQHRLVSVIMPALNRASIIGEAIGSVVEQSYTNWELIVIDDGSTDGTAAAALASGDQRIRVIGLEKNVGPAAARNAGLRSARGSLFAYLDSDNLWMPDYLLVMVNALMDSPRRSGAYCAQRLTERLKNEVADGVRFGPFGRALLENFNYVDINALVHDRAALDRIGGFDERVDPSEDWDLVLRLSAERPLLAVPALLSHYRYDYALSPQSDVGDTARAVEQIRTGLASRSFRLPLAGRAPVPPEAIDYRFFPAGEVRTLSRPGRFATIIVPSFEAPSYLDACLQAVSAFTTPGTYEVVVIDNASGPETRAVLGTHRRNPAIRLIENERNYGFTYAVNQGIVAARPDSDVVLLNNDALVTPGWLEALREVVELIPDAGIALPRQVMLPGTKTMKVHVPDANVGNELDVNLSDHHANVLDPSLDPDRGFVELTFAPFFCAYITRECVRAVGLLDWENGRHYGSDRVYCDLVRDQAGLRLVYTPHAKVYHFLQRATADLQERRREEYREVYVENRWEGARPPPLVLPEGGDEPVRSSFVSSSKRDHPLDLLALALIDLNGVSPDDGSLFPNHFEPPSSVRERRAIRLEGCDWPAHALTMVGLWRLKQLREAIETVVSDGVPGDVVETGVWRGGASIFARATLRALNVTDRTVWCADSFAGLPPPDVTRYPIEEGDTHHQVEYLKVGLPEVKRGFEQFGLLDDRVRFLPGWFSETLPHAPIESIAVLRLDADMYGSTIEALRHLYPRVSPGGFVIIDDYGAIQACRRAVDDYRAENGIVAPLQFIDRSGRFWQIRKRFTNEERATVAAADRAAPEPDPDIWPGHERWENRQRTEQARRRFDAGDVAAARSLAMQVLEEEPNNLAAALVLADIEFPGPDYLAALRDIHARRKPSAYVELGVFKGDSLNLASPACRTIAVDPRPMMEEGSSTNARMFRTTSQHFFASGNAERWLDHGFDLAFIDASHRFASALLDFMCLERFARSGAAILMHDTMPFDERMASPVRSTTFYSGDVWKVIQVLRELRPDLALYTIPCAPSGLTVIENLNPASTVLWTHYSDTVARFEKAPFTDFISRRETLLNVVRPSGANASGS